MTTTTTTENTMTNSTTDTITNLLSNLKPGQSVGARTAQRFVQVAPQETGGYTVMCGWAVPEAYGDDHDSCLGHAAFFSPPTSQPWVGREYRFGDNELPEAVACYAAVKEAVYARRIPEGGDVIGSVSR